MSCQQTTRLTEDPYAFTEPPLLSVILPATPNSHKTTTIYSTKSQQQNQFVDKKNHHNQLNHQKKILNGVLHSYNGISKQINSLVPVNGIKKHIVQQKVISSKTLPISHDPSSIKTIIGGSFTNSNFSPIQQTLPPQSTQIQYKHVSSCPNPKITENKLNNNHSISTSSPIVKRRKSIKSQNLLISAPQSASLKTSPPPTTPLHTTTKQQQQQQKYQHLITKDTFISGNVPNVSNVNIKYEVPDLKPDFLLDGIRNDINTFLVPKVEVKSHSATTTKKNGKYGVNNKEKLPKKNRKRTNTSSPHHETLQRISNKCLQKLSGIASGKVKSPTRIPLIPKVWHAPESYIFDYSGPGNPDSEKLRLTTCVNNTWYTDLDASTSTSDTTINNTILLSTSSSSPNVVSREQRLMMKKISLRRQAVQYWNAVLSRDQTASKKRLISVSKTLNKFENYYKSSPQNKCSITNCKHASLPLTAYCFQHITQNSEQKLFHPCTAKFLDNTQCRIPVFDISHESPLCREHGWKRDNYDKMIQEQKPKKPPRKKTKPSAMTRPPKRNKKKKKLTQKQLEKISSSSSPPTNYTSSFNNHHHHHNNNHNNHQFINSHNNHITNNIIHRDNIIIGKTGSNHLYETMDISSLDSILNQTQHDEINPYNDKHYKHGTTTQDMLCENSSAYESSEDTGVGGLSESELIGPHDVIEEIPFEMGTHDRLLEENDLITNVLNQIPTEALNELFNVQQNGTYEPSQEEEEDLARALEAVDEHVKSLEQMTADSTNFLSDFMDVDDEILDSTDICDDSILQSSNSNHQNSNEIRGLVHT